MSRLLESGDVRLLESGDARLLEGEGGKIIELPGGFSAKLELGNVGIKLEAEFTKEKPTCFKSIKAIIDLKDAKIDDRRKKALIQFVKNCPVHNTLEANPQIDISA